jgi:pyruvate,water dikinase
MVFAEASGIMFTADPVTGNRLVTSVEATFGLGESLVSGIVSGDSYKVRDDEVVSRSIAIKRGALHATAAGGTQERGIEPERQQKPALADAQVVQLARLGRRIEAHFGRPQDIEWCFADDDFQIVQSRPITTLFPIPGGDHEENRVYVSVGHQQMMTDAMKPLGLSIWQLTAAKPMYEAGGRLFVDVTPVLASPASRHGLVEVLGKSDPLIRDALRTVLDRRDFIRSIADDVAGPPQIGAAPAAVETDPSIIAGLIERAQSSIAVLKRDIATKSGPALFEYILADLQELKRILFDPLSHQAIMAGIEATWWLNERLQEWLGEKNAADTLAQSAPNNVTSEMGLALLDVADAIRPYPELVTSLHDVRDDAFLDDLPVKVRSAVLGWLDTYGMRCAGEIDITRPRWSERPSTLVPVILGNIRNFAPGEARRRFEQGIAEARKKETELLQRLRTLPEGEQKAEEVKRMIDRLRSFVGYREYPKYHMVSRYFVYKQALLEEAARLVGEGVLREKEDIFYLKFEELFEVVRTKRVDHELIRRRSDSFAAYQALHPSRVITSEGEVINGAYHREDVPAGALIGSAVSTGIVEGRARVIVDMAEADLEAGDILVTRFTDPSWTPVFVSIAGLVTEVGGLMTHGAVIAREYGLPAVVGVEHATRSIQDGQRIRVHGTDGYVEILNEQSSGK